MPAKSIADLPPELKGTWQAVDLTGGQDGLLLKTQTARLARGEARRLLQATACAG